MTATYSLKTLATRQTDDDSIIITKGIVIAERSNVRSERAITLYTDRLGVIDVFARGAKGTKNALYSGLALFQYCEFGISERKGHFFTVSSAESLNSFFSLSETLEGISLALYCAELVRIIGPVGDEATQHLPFFLNTLHLINKRKYDLDLLKAIFELRTMSGHGFMPTAVACSSCFEYKETPHMLDYRSGSLLCEDCASKQAQGCNLSTAGMAAMRHIIFSDIKSIFSFKINNPEQSGLLREVERFTLWHLDKKPKSLEFYHNITTKGNHEQKL